jgi:Fe-S cluster assembly protein SufD
LPAKGKKDDFITAELCSQTIDNRMQPQRIAASQGRAAFPHVGIADAKPRHLSRSPSLQCNAVADRIEDAWIEQFSSSVVEKGMDVQGGLRPLNDVCRQTLSSLRVPTLRNEEYRFTDLSPLTNASLYWAEGASDADITELVAGTGLDAEAVRVVVVDGVVRSVEGPVPPEAYVGSVEGAPEDILRFSLGSQSKSRGGPFATLNGASARDCTVVYVPENCTFAAPIHIINVSSASGAGAGAGPGTGGMAFSAPRVLAFLEAGSAASIIEEFVSLPGAGGAHASFSVMEIELDDAASLTHKFVELDCGKAVNLKSTLVSQGKESTYSLTEVRLGGELTRHDVGIVQLGERTHTEMKHFLLAGERQTHDLHTTLQLDHPEGTADQVHKCIAVADSSKGVFDGNVRVNRMAQRTDAGQLSRNLLLAPRATVNVKPNLQIVADDVKCTHGCAVSDLEAEQLFYLQTRGIDPSSARKMLVYSFGGEVTQKLNDKQLVERVTSATTGALDAAFNRQA